MELIVEEIRRMEQSAPAAPISRLEQERPPVASAPFPAPTPHRLAAEPCRENPASCKRAADTASDALRRMQSSTAARIGIGRCGPRMKTASLLDFQADHAAAKDAVIQDVPEPFLDRLGLIRVETRCRDRNEYLTRPDLGRVLSPEAEATLLEKCRHAPEVQIIAAEGLSSVAIQANLENILPVLEDSLAAMGIRTGTPFYVRFGRVAVEDAVAVLLDAEVVCLLVGERPGLVSAESMSAYIAYRATPGMPESRRTVVSNIHRGGTAAAEAGAYVADIIQQILKEKKSGVELKR